jgi:3-deoxy-D-manno-octulosonic-acid transferase
VTGAAMWWVYAAASFVAWCVAWPFLALAAALGRRDIALRMGRVPPGMPRGAVWAHAASVGEVTALKAVLDLVVRRTGFRGLVLSTMTVTGMARAGRIFRSPVTLAPLDSPVPAARVLARLAPRSLVVMETELWPVWLWLASRRAKLAWVNGRISDRSYPWYRLLRPLIARVLARFSLLCVISPTDAARAIELGAPRSRIRITGNVKADLVVPARPPHGVRKGPWLVAGSTRPGEEKAVLEAFRMGRTRIPDLKLCLAPRHLNRAVEVLSLARRAGWSVELRSHGGRGRADVLVLDTHGELASFYRLAVAAFVGGTLARVGGHNVLEPAAAGVPVLFGPHTANVRDYAAGLVSSGGGFTVASGTGMGGRLIALLEKGRARKAGRRAASYVRSVKGAARRTAVELAKAGIA